MRFEGYRTGSDREVRIGFKVGLLRWRLYPAVYSWRALLSSGSKLKKTELMDSIRTFRVSQRRRYILTIVDRTYVFTAGHIMYALVCHQWLIIEEAIGDTRSDPLRPDPCGSSRYSLYIPAPLPLQVIVSTPPCVHLPVYARMYANECNNQTRREGW